MSILADIIRAAAVADAKPMSNRAIALLTNVAPETINRIMRGEGSPDVETIDKIADALDLPRSQLRDAANLPRGLDEPYQPPAESRLLDLRQRAAMDEMIRAIVSPPVDDLQQIEELLRGLGDEDLHRVSVLATELSDEREQAALDTIADYAAKEGITPSEMLRRIDDEHRADHGEVPAPDLGQQSDYDLMQRRGTNVGRQMREAQDRDAENSQETDG